MPLTITNCVIHSGQSVSDPVVLGDDYIVGLIAPALWTPAVCTVLVSPLGVTFYDMYDAAGGEFSFNVLAGRMIAVDASRFLGVAFLKLRSGTGKDPVNQAADRTFTLIATKRTP